ncbi:FGGY-family carbohydrate kinase [Celeribacter marinus]|uniref:FGGY-family carbohydrate kinase n=1 Tax=Celeribacter marinus TaxID=1397108 RepID=UPI00317EB659
MTVLRHIAVLDVGKTNAKLALVDAQTLTEIAVVTRPNTVIDTAPYPHFDLDGHWAFFVDHLAQVHKTHGIDAISITTHGASCVLLGADGALATPMLDYEHTGPDDLAVTYDEIRPDFAQTGSPRLPAGLNVGAQLYWLFNRDPDLLDRTAHIVTYPQYWGFRLTGAVATDVTSLGCHTDLWQPREGQFSDLVDRLNIRAKLAPAQTSNTVLGTLTQEVAIATGLPRSTPVSCGIHDSNASLLPHIIRRKAPFSVISTGTWVVALAVGAVEGQLDPTRDTLINVSAFGDPVPSARFMGGREFDMIRDGSNATPTDGDRSAVLGGTIMLLPSVVRDSGPFKEREYVWTHAPTTDGARIYALSLYLALMTQTCLDLIGARGPAVVEGPFARNSDYLNMLAALRPDGVEIEGSATGTSIGAAMLLSQGTTENTATRIDAPSQDDLRAYAREWTRMVNARA